MDRFSHPHAGLQDEQDDLRESPGLSESVNCCMGHRRCMSKIGLGKQILRGSPYHAVHWDGYSILPDVIVVVLTCPGDSDTSCGDLAEALLDDAKQGVP